VRHWAKPGATTPVADLLQLPSGERLALALALWDSLEEEGRREALPVDTVLSDELDRGWAAHLKDPAAAVPWHSIRINDQFRICFSWTAAGPEEVEIVDYH
jgi:putative addiction module component (TIGR02574 family)